MSETKTTSTSTSASDAYDAIPSADELKVFAKNRAAQILWRFNQGAKASMIQHKYNPISMALNFELTADEEKIVKAKFATMGFNVMVTSNDLEDPEQKYVTKLDIYFAGKKK